MAEKERLYRMKEACAILGVHPNTIRQWDKQGKIQVVRPKGGQRRIPESEINRLLHKIPVAPTPSGPAVEREGLSSFLNYVFSFHRDDWVLVKKAVIIRDNYACQECGRKELLEVHHKDGTPRNDSENLITLCQECHNSIHKRAPVRKAKVRKPRAVPPKPEKPIAETSPPKPRATELSRHAILDKLAPSGLAQRTVFGDLLSAAAVLKTFTPTELATRARCPDAITQTFCERMRACGYLAGKNGKFGLQVRLAR